MLKVKLQRVDQKKYRELLPITAETILTPGVHR